MDGVLPFLAVRAIPGVEEVDGATYRRALGGRVVEAGAPALGHGDPAAARAVLAADPGLAPAVAARPALRVPGTLARQEVAIRAVLGQQVSVAGARTLAARLADALGTPLPRPAGGVVREFPAMDVLADCPDALLAMPAARRRAIRGLAAALAGGLDPADRDAMLALPGIGPWTADYVRWRLGEPDVLLAGDLAVRTAARRAGLPDGARALAEHGERWAPHRSLATAHLYASLS
jgi:AraC family transcriptional regulator of adaptative response / DNA-3-methyladenine glycosylase II